MNILKSGFSLIIAVLFISGCTNAHVKRIKDRIQPVSPNSGFNIEGYWVWGGSVIKVGSTYHMFASRWPRKNKFVSIYRDDTKGF